MTRINIHAMSQSISNTAANSQARAATQQWPLIQGTVSVSQFADNVGCGFEDQEIRIFQKNTAFAEFSANLPSLRKQALWLIFLKFQPAVP